MRVISSYQHPGEIDIECVRYKKTNKIRIIQPKYDLERKYTLVGVDRNCAIVDGMAVTVDKLSSKINSEQIILCLTCVELVLLRSILGVTAKVFCFERLFPIFDVKNTTSRLNFSVLTKLYAVVLRRKIPSVGMSKYLSTKAMKSVSRKVKYKNTLDKLFCLYDEAPYQEVFKLKEERVNRKIICLDFNSMFASCFMERYIDPQEIRFLTEQEICSSREFCDMPDGLYHVELDTIQSEFFSRYHPFSIKHISGQYKFTAEQNSTIRTLLFKSELEYFSRFFKRTRILSAIVSDQAICHPMAGKAIKVYKQRKAAKENDEVIREKVLKHELLMMHSATNTTVEKTKHFDSINAVSCFIHENFNIKLPEMYKKNYILCACYIERVGLGELEKISENAYKFKFLDIASARRINSLYRQVISYSKLKMIKVIERFLQIDTCEICYANVDSIHVSIDENKEKPFFDAIIDLVGKNIGQLKIEAMGSRGYWFDVGRYWIFKNDVVVLHKNAYFNNGGIFDQSRLSMKIQKGPFGNFIKNEYAGIYDAFSYRKKIMSVDIKEEGVVEYGRYLIDEVITEVVAISSRSKEKLKSHRMKIKTFVDMKNSSH